MSGVVAKDCSFSGSFVFWREGGREEERMGLVLFWFCVCVWGNVV